VTDRRGSVVRKWSVRKGQERGEKKKRNRGGRYRKGWEKRDIFQQLTVMTSGTLIFTARTMPWQVVGPSVRPTPVFCLNSYTYPQSFFSLSGSPIILVFSLETERQYSDRDPLTGASNARGV